LMPKLSLIMTNAKTDRPFKSMMIFDIAINSFLKLSILCIWFI